MAREETRLETSKNIKKIVLQRLLTKMMEKAKALLA